MRLHLRLIAVFLVAAGLVGGVLALTVLDTDEGPDAPDDLPTTATGAMIGATGSTTDYAQAIPLPIEGPLLGVNLTAYTRDGYADPAVREMIGTLAELGSTAITLVPTWYMKSSTAELIAAVQSKTPSDESLETVIGWIREAGMRLVIKPHVDVIDDSYRGEIQPADRDRWFRSYRRFIKYFASFSTENEADLFVVGTELKTLSGVEGRWRALIRQVRDRFAGPLTYAANWDEVDQVRFWDELDAIGVDAYYPLTAEGDPAPSLPELVAAWGEIANRLKATSKQWDRPVIVTEVGYPSQIGATARPYEVTGKPEDQNIQAMAYRATFKALSGADWLEGISWWSWRADPGPEENLAVEYTPKGKKAQGVLAQGQWIFEG